MTQYCRYCCWCSVGDVAYCDKFKKTMSDRKAKHTNHCKWFDFNEIDAFGENKVYKPRKSKDKKDGLRLF